MVWSYNVKRSSIFDGENCLQFHARDEGKGVDEDKMKGVISDKEVYCTSFRRVTLVYYSRFYSG